MYRFELLAVPLAVRQTIAKSIALQNTRLHPHIPAPLIHHIAT